MKSVLVTVLRGVPALCAVVAVTLSGCARPTASTVATAPAATMPPGVTSVVTDLGARTWTRTPGMHRVGSDTAPAFRYTGTGHKVWNESAALLVPVTPGTVYVFSAQTDLAGTTGEPDVLIDTADGHSSYTIMYAKAPVSRVVSTAPWKAPPGVTRVLVGMQIALNIVERGRNLTFTHPVLRSATPPGTP